MKIDQLGAHYQNIESIMRTAQMASWRPITAHEVALEMTEVPESAIRQNMDEMVGLGRLIRSGRGVSYGYRLATPAQRHLFEEKFGLRPRGDISMSWHTEMVYGYIEKAVGQAYRDLRRGVFPRDVQPRLPYSGRAEGSLRRDMLAMYQAGRLVRVMGHGRRQGYRLPNLVEKMAFRINQGMWPYGTESVVVWA